MADTDLDQLITDAVSSVLETMFFTLTATGTVSEANDPTSFRARVEFRGSSTGFAEVCLSEVAARMLAANFLGEEEKHLARSDLEMIVCELANMLTGSVVSKLKSDETFDLSSPRIVLDQDQEFPEASDGSTARRCFELETGSLAMVLRIVKAA